MMAVALIEQQVSNQPDYRELEVQLRAEIPDLNHKLEMIGLNPSELEDILAALINGDIGQLRGYAQSANLKLESRLNEPKNLALRTLKSEWEGLEKSQSPEAEFRRKIHEEIIAEELDQVEEALRKNSSKPSAVEIKKSLTFVAGLPGAGKTTHFNEAMSMFYAERILLVDVDRLREKLWKKLQDSYVGTEHKSAITSLGDYDETNYDHVMALQPEAARLAKELVLSGLSSSFHFPIMYVGTLRNEGKARELINAAKVEVDVIVSVVHMFIHLVDCFKRILQRDRLVDLDTLLEALGTYDTLRSLVASRSVDVVDLNEISAVGISTKRGYPIDNRNDIIAGIDNLRNKYDIRS